MIGLLVLVLLKRRKQEKGCNIVNTTRSIQGSISPNLLFWEECLAKQKNLQVSQNKTPSSTLDTPNVLGMKDKKTIQPNILHNLGTMNVSLPSSQAKSEIISSHVDAGLLENDLPNLKETQPLLEKYVDEIPMKIIS
jgi:hypothetical protein